MNKKSMRVDSLYDYLQKAFNQFFKAIEEQDFEEAAETRDNIKKLLKANMKVSK